VAQLVIGVPGPRQTVEHHSLGKGRDHGVLGVLGGGKVGLIAQYQVRVQPRTGLHVVYSCALRIHHLRGTDLVSAEIDKGLPLGIKHESKNWGWGLYFLL
jgi:hypothetical protein